MENPCSIGPMKRRRNSSDEMGSFKIIHTDTDANDLSLNANKKRIVSEYKITYNDVRQSNRHKNPSGVWKYFAFASKYTSSSSAKNPKAETDDRILCMLCYSKGRVHVYKSKTSSSNLWKHLNRKHDIEIPSEKIFVVSSTSFDGFEYNGTEVGEGSSPNEYTMSGLDMDNNDRLIKADDFEVLEEYPKEHLHSRGSCGDDEQSVQTISKYDVIQTSVSVQNDIGLAIIEEVSKRPILYETQSSKQLSIRATREMMWAEVYEALGEVVQIERIQKIWKNIRDRYKKIRNNERDGMECLPKYKYYDYLSFLDEYDERLRNQVPDIEFTESLEKKPNTDDYSFLIEQTEAEGILSPENNLVQCSDQQNYTTEDVISETSNCTVSSSNPPQIIGPIFPMGMHNITENTPAKHSPSTTPPAAPVSSVTNKIEQLDEFDLFGKLIANKLRSAPKDKVNLIEVKIMQVILENI